MCLLVVMSSLIRNTSNTGDIPTVFGGTPDLGSYANPTSAFIGETVHCGLGDTACSGATGAVQDTPPAANKPGSATFEGLFGHKNIQPVLSARAHPRAPYRAADGAGNLVDLDNREIADFRGNVGFPGFSPTASQSLAVLADMQEAGIPVTVFGARESTHNKLNADLGRPDDPATKALFEFLAGAIKK